MSHMEKSDTPGKYRRKGRGGEGSRKGEVTGFTRWPALRNAPEFSARVPGEGVCDQWFHLGTGAGAEFWEGDQEPRMWEVGWIQGETTSTGTRGPERWWEGSARTGYGWVHQVL